MASNNRPQALRGLWLREREGRGSWREAEGERRRKGGRGERESRVEGI